MDQFAWPRGTYRLAVLSHLRYSRRSVLIHSALGRLLASTLSALLAAVTLTTTAAAAQPPPSPDLYVQMGHAEPVTSVAFSPDGVFLASSSSDRTVKLWHVATGRLLRTLAGHTVGASSVAFDPSGTILASADGDGIIRFWDTNTGRMLRELGRTETPPPRPAIHALAFSPDGSTLAAALSDRRVVLWDVKTGQRGQTLSGHRAAQNVELLAMWRLGGARTVAFDQSGRLLASGGTDGQIIVWNAETGTERVVLTGHVGEIRALGFAAGGMLASSGADGTVRIWDVATGRGVRTFAGDGPLAVSADGASLASSRDGAIQVWSVGDGRLEHEIVPRWEGFQIVVGHVLGITALAFDASGTMLASGGAVGDVKLWDRAGDVERQTLERTPSPSKTVRFSPNGKWLATAASGNAYLWNLGSGLPTFLAGYDAYSSDALGFTENSRRLVTPKWTVEVDTGAMRQHPASRGDVLCEAVSPDGTLIATGRPNGEVSVRDVATGREIRTLQGHTNAVSGLAFSVDGRLLVTAGQDVTVRVWDVLTGSAVRVFAGDNAPGAGFLGYQTVAISQDARWVVAAGTSPRLSFGLSRWDIRSGAGRHVTADRLPAKALALSSDGSMLASVSEHASSVQLWDLTTLQPITALIEHDQPIQSVAFSPDRQWLASAGGDGVVRLWRMPTGTLAATLVGYDGGWLAATPDGRFDGSPAGWTRVLWRLGPRALDVEPAETFFGDYYTPGLLAFVISGRPRPAIRGLATLDRRRPSVALALAPESTPAGKDRRIRLRITVAETGDAGARDVRLFRDGTLVRAWREEVPIVDRVASTTYEATVAIVSGPNRFTAYAFNRDNVKSDDARLTVRGDEALERSGSLHIVSVGIDRYSSPLVKPLRYALDDVRALALELKQRQQDLSAFAETNIHILALVNEAATRANILSVLHRLGGVETASPAADAPRALRTARRVEPEDTVIIHFAGHGLADGDRFHFLPHDLRFPGPTLPDARQFREVLRGSVSDFDLAVALERIDAFRIVMIIDACESGQLLGSGEARHGPLNSRGLAQLAWEKGAVILTAAQAHQAAYEDTKYRHGLLTYALVAEGLRTEAADRSPVDGRVELLEWFDYASRRVPQLQLELMQSARAAGHNLAVVDGEQGIDDVTLRTLQQPRIFYRRDHDSSAFVVVERRPSATRPIRPEAR